MRVGVSVCTCVHAWRWVGGSTCTVCQLKMPLVQKIKCSEMKMGNLVPFCGLLYAEDINIALITVKYCYPFGCRWT